MSRLISCAKEKKAFLALRSGFVPGRSCFPHLINNNTLGRILHYFEREDRGGLDDIDDSKDKAEIQEENVENCFSESVNELEIL